MKKSILIVIVCIVFTLSGVTTFAESNSKNSEEPQGEATVEESTVSDISEETQPAVVVNDGAQVPSSEVADEENIQQPMSEPDSNKKPSPKVVEKSNDANNLERSLEQRDTQQKVGGYYYDYYSGEYLWCSHPSKSYDYSYPLNSTYHNNVYYCNECGDSIYVKRAHRNRWYKFEYEDDGEYDYDWFYGCKDCSYEEYSAQLSYTVAYKKKKYVKVYLTGNVCRGDMLTVKVGKKTYKKKITSSANDPMYKLKIKKPKKNKKVRVYVTHRGEKLYLGWDYVMTSWNPKKGMTKKQVENYTAWGSPDETHKSSGGYSYWYYDDGSYIVFKKGRVKHWYE